MRLATGELTQDFDRVVAALTHLVEVEHVALFADHMIIGEAYVALQHHYAVSKPGCEGRVAQRADQRLGGPIGRRSSAGRTGQQPRLRFAGSPDCPEVRQR
jgi:hypothetical protein